MKVASIGFRTTVTLPAAPSPALCNQASLPGGGEGKAGSR
jgi:hypothetical protein